MASIGFDEDDDGSTTASLSAVDVATLARLGVGVEVVVYRAAAKE